MEHPENSGEYKGLVVNATQLNGVGKLESSSYEVSFS